MTRDALVSHKGHRRFISITPLNRETTRRYLACGDRHQPSGVSVLRQYPGRVLELQVCARCSVPFGGPRIVSSQDAWNGVDK